MRTQSWELRRKCVFMCDFCILQRKRGEIFFTDCVGVGGAKQRTKCSGEMQRQEPGAPEYTRESVFTVKMMKRKKKWFDKMGHLFCKILFCVFCWRVHGSNIYINLGFSALILVIQVLKNHNTNGKRNWNKIWNFLGNIFWEISKIFLKWARERMKWWRGELTEESDFYWIWRFFIFCPQQKDEVFRWFSWFQKIRIKWKIVSLNEKKRERRKHKRIGKVIICYGKRKENENRCLCCLCS